MVWCRLQSSATANRGQERDLVARFERGRPSGELTIPRGGYGLPMRSQLGVPGHAMGEKVLNTGIRWNFDGFLTVTNGVLQSSKKEHIQAHGIGVFGRHMRIVALGRDCGQRSGVVGSSMVGPEGWNPEGPPLVAASQINRRLGEPD